MKKTAPTNLELQALSVLWEEGPSTVQVVLENLPDGKERAYTTVLSVLQGMQRKGLVKRTKSGRAHTYSAAGAQSKVLGPLTKNFVRDAFNGNVGAAVLQVLSAGTLTPEGKEEVEAAVSKAKTKAAKKKPAKKEAAPAKKAAKKTAKKAAKKSAKKAAKKSAKKAAKGGKK